jgi:hypothetical protein
MIISARTDGPLSVDRTHMLRRWGVPFSKVEPLEAHILATPGRSAPDDSRHPSRIQQRRIRASPRAKKARKAGAVASWRPPTQCVWTGRRGPQSKKRRHPGRDRRALTNARKSRRLQRVEQRDTKRARPYPEQDGRAFHPTARAEAERPGRENRTCTGPVARGVGRNRASRGGKLRLLVGLMQLNRI